MIKLNILTITGKMVDEPSFEQIIIKGNPVRQVYFVFEFDNGNPKYKSEIRVVAMGEKNCELIENLITGQEICISGILRHYSASVKQTLQKLNSNSKDIDDILIAKQITID